MSQSEKPTGKDSSDEKKRDLALKLRELDQKDRELDIEDREKKERLQLDKEKTEREMQIRQQELKAKRREVWFPLWIAFVLSLLALVGNVWVTHINNRVAQRLAKEKNDSERELQHRKAQSDLVLEAIKTNSPEKAHKTLELIVKTGLLEDPDKKIQHYVEKTPASETPTLPVLVSTNVPPPAIDSGPKALRLQAVDSQGNPLARAEFTCNARGRFTKNRVTDQEGKFTCLISGGLMSVLVQVQTEDGFKEERIMLTPETLREVQTIMLGPRQQNK